MQLPDGLEKLLPVKVIEKLYDDFRVNGRRFLMILPKGVAVLCLLTIGMLGCSGQLYTVIEATPKDRGDEGKYLKGITAYLPKLYIERYHLTLYVVDGKILRRKSADHNDQKCFPAVKESIVTRPDYSAPYQLVYDPGFLESREFGVILKDGMVTAVNIKSTPDRGETAKNILSPITELASSALGFAAADEVLCNANPVLQEIVPYTNKISKSP